MPARRRRRPGSDRLYVTTEDGLPLGHVDLGDGTTHDVPAVWRDRFLREANAWLWQNNLPPLAGGGEEQPTPVLEAGVEAPEGGWDPGWEDLALHRPGHLMADEAARARTSGVRDADRPSRLRADGQHAVDDALAKLTRPRLRRGRTARWRILHAVDMAFEEPARGGLTAADVRRGGPGPAAGGTPSRVLLDHVVIGPPGVFVIEVQNHPGGRAYIGPESLEIDGAKIDLGRRRRLGEEAGRRLSAGLAAAAGAAETLNPPIVTPVIAVVGAIVIGLDRPRGVLVSRVGHLPRLLQAFGPQLVDEAVDQVHTVARRSDVWL